MWRNKRVHQPSGLDLEHHSYIFIVGGLIVVGDPGSIPGKGRIIYLIIFFHSQVGDSGLSITHIDVTVWVQLASSAPNSCPPFGLG